MNQFLNEHKFHLISLSTSFIFLMTARQQYHCLRNEYDHDDRRHKMLYSITCLIQILSKFIFIRNSPKRRSGKGGKKRLNISESPNVCYENHRWLLSIVIIKTCLLDYVIMKYKKAVRVSLV